MAATMQEMSDIGGSTELDRDIIDVHALLWRLLEFNVSRYGSFPTGQLLIVLTFVLLDEAGYFPTVTELAEITGLPKSTVSRYISTELSKGDLEEVIDPRDRRRRRLRRSQKAHEEANWHRQQVREIAAGMRLAFAPNDDGEQPGAELQAALAKRVRSAAAGDVGFEVLYPRRVL